MKATMIHPPPTSPDIQITMTMEEAHLLHQLVRNITAIEATKIMKDYATVKRAGDFLWDLHEALKIYRRD